MSFIGTNPATAFYAAAAAFVPYILLSGVAVWSTLHNSSTSPTWMRIPLLAMFIVLTTVVAFNTVLFQWQQGRPTDGIIAKADPVLLLRDTMQIGLNIATCLTGVLSDGLLAWRCYILFGKRPWVRWLLIVMIALDFGIGSFSNIALGTLVHADADPEHLYSINKTKIEETEILSQVLIVVWAWLFFALNTTMTMSILYKIISAAHRAKVLAGPGTNHHIYTTVIRGIIESSFIAWVGLLVYAIASTYFFARALTSKASQGALATYQVAFTILPFIFGISQSLIIARIGFSRMRAPSSAAKHTALLFASDPFEDHEEPIQSKFIVTCGGDDIEMGSTRTQSQSQHESIG